MSTSTPPFNAQFRYMNETWKTIGWAKKPEQDYVWCRQDEATHVIGENVDSSAGQANWIAPIADVGSVSPKRDWKYDLPDYIRVAQREKADENIGKRVRTHEGNLVFL
jgi:hypothetical protein